MANQASASSSRTRRTTRNSLGLRRGHSERESSVESIDSVGSVGSTASTRRTRKARHRRAASSPPNATTARTSPTPLSPPANNSSELEPNTANPTAAPSNPPVFNLAPIDEETVEAASPLPSPSPAVVLATESENTEAIAPEASPSATGTATAYPTEDAEITISQAIQPPTIPNPEETPGLPVPEPAAPETAVAEPAAEPAAIESAVLEPAAPEPTVPELAAPEPVVPEPATPKPAVRKRVYPKLVVRRFAALAPASPVRDVQLKASRKVTDDEKAAPPDETSTFATYKQEGGQTFGSDLYAAIEAGRFEKHCICPLPTIYQSKEEAESGTGVFRFYRSGGHPGDVHVFMKQNDSIWHCRCEAQYIRTSRKRKAEDSEIDLVAANSERDEDSPSVQSAVRVVPRPEEPEEPEESQEPPKSMRSIWDSITGRVKGMSDSIKGWFSQLGARISEAAHEAVETRKYENGHLVVKRFKRQYCLPVASAAEEDEQPSLFDQLPYFDWASSATKHIGEPAIRCIKDALWRQVCDIRRGFICYDTSVDALATRHREGGDPFDLDLSTAIFNLMIKHHGVATESNYLKAISLYERGAGLTVGYLNAVYLRSELLPILRGVFPKPPKHLDYFGDFEFKTKTRIAGDFLTWLLTQKELFEIDGNFQLALTKIIVDIDAVHKQEVLPSLVEFPGNGTALMPGSFVGEEEVMEKVPASNFIIEPVYECKHPDTRPPTSASPRFLPTPADSEDEQPRDGTEDHEETEGGLPDLAFSTPRPPKGILKKEPKKWPENPATPEPEPQTPDSKSRTLRFQSPIAFFTPPKKAPKKTPKPARRLLDTKTPIRKATPKTTATKLPSSLHQLKSYGTYFKSLYETAFPPYVGTKYGEFLEETRRELYRQPGRKLPPPQPTNAEVLRQREALRRKAREDMTPEERRHELDLFVRDLELAPNGEVVRRKDFLPESELIIATRQLGDHDAAHQLRQDMDARAEKERQRMAALIAEEKRLRVLEEKRKVEEARLRREEEELRVKEAERLRLEEQQRAEREAQRLREVEEREALRRLRAPSSPLITPITDEWRSKVLGIAGAPPSAELAKTPDGQALNRRDFEEKLLPTTAWLNDNVITGSILHVGAYVNAKAGATAQDPKCAAFTSYFWPRLESAGPAQCGRLMRRAGVRKDNFLDIESILIPICAGSHWTLAVVLPGRRIVAHLDSLRGGHGSSAVTRRLLDWVKVTLAETFVPDEWDVQDFSAPLQRNGWDCGVFTITNGLCLALGLDPLESYTAEQLTLQRERLAAVLLNGGFKGEFDLEGI